MNTLGALAPSALFHGRYRIVNALRAGGMGAVYEVIDERTGGRRALKVIHPDLLHHSGAGEEYRARFAREATVTGSIESDHLVRVLDAGVDEATGLPFLTMELLRGQDLGALLRDRGTLPGVEVCTYLGQASLGLDKTHEAGIVHRDLKPENLFLTHRDDGSPCIKVLDFGIAKTTRAEVVAETTGVVGSPLYMAPEQLMLDEPIGPPVDVYALGQTAYTLLVGEPYWRPEYERASSPIAAALQLSSGISVPMTARARSRKNVELPAALDAWFERCVARRPTHRYASASEAVVALAEALGVTSTAPASVTPAIPISVSAAPSPPQTGVRSRAIPFRAAEPAIPSSRETGKRPRAGFRVEVDPKRALARVEVWGFWTVEDGRAYLEEFRQKTRPLWGKPWYVLAMSSEFPAQKPEVTAFVGQTMELARQNGFVRAANLVSSTLTKMQLSRMSAEQGLPEYSFFQDEAEAVRWLLGTG